MAGTNFDQAMERLRDEMAKQANHGGIAAIGEYFTQQLEMRPGIAGQLLERDKSLSGAYRELEKAARARAKGSGCVVISDREGFAIAEKYYGIPAAPEGAEKIMPQAAPAQAAAPLGLMELDDLLAGL